MTHCRLTPMVSAVCLALLISACDESDTTYMVGTLERDRIELKVESNEPVSAIHVNDGDTVEASAPILDQDSARATARLAQQTALHRQAAARLAELVRGPREETIRETRAKLEASQVQRVNALASVERTREVFARGLSSQGRLDRDETNYQTAIAQEKADLEALERLLNGTTVEELEQASATVAAAKARVQLAELDLERTRLLAPQTGVVDKVLYQLGERPAAGTTIAVLLDSSRIFARVYVPEYLRASMTVGRTLNVRIDGIGKNYEGTLRWVSSDASFTPYFALTEHDRSRLSYLAEIDVPDAGELPTGLPLQVDFPAVNDK
jgi:HlyD family secretion protein